MNESTDNIIINKRACSCDGQNPYYKFAYKREKTMAFDKKQYDQRYAREHYQRVPLNLKFELYNQVKTSADSVGSSVSDFIRRAIEHELYKMNYCKKESGVNDCSEEVKISEKAESLDNIEKADKTDRLEEVAASSFFNNALGVKKGFKYCRNCGNQLPTASKFCDKCGSRLDY